VGEVILCGSDTLVRRFGCWFWCLLEKSIQPMAQPKRKSKASDMSVRPTRPMLGPRLHLNYRYGNFYNCPTREKGISVTGDACCMLA
jgi:hypothetical protein